MNRKDTVCPLPWNSVFINENQVNICCNTMTPALDDNGVKFKIDSLPTLKDSKFYKQLKQDMLDGVQNPACDRCWKMEPESFRTRVYNKDFKDTYDLICSDAPEHLPLEHMSISIGNVCNLNCRMCDPNSSSMIAKEWRRTHPLGRSGQFLQLIATDDKGRNNSFLGDPVFLDYVKDNHSKLKDIYIFGGEPFIIIDEHLKFLQLLVDLGVSKNIRLSYSTNGTNTNMRRFTDLFKQFRQVILSVSTDGMGECYDYIRWPNNWEKHTKSLEYYKNLVKENPNFVVSVACTVQVLLLKQYKEFDRHIREDYGFDRFYIPVNYPDEFSLAVAPKQLLEEVYEQNVHEQLNSIIKPYIDNYDEEQSKELFDKFLKVTKWQDEYREQSLYDFYPEIRNWHGGV